MEFLNSLRITVFLPKLHDLLIPKLVSKGDMGKEIHFAHDKGGVLLLFCLNKKKKKKTLFITFPFLYD